MVKKSDRIPFQSFRSSENYSLALRRLNGNYEVFRRNTLQKECLKKLSEWHPAQKHFLTQSATAGLMMVADSIDFSHGDEIIVPSFTFVSALNPFVRRGVNLVFVPANENTLGPDLDSIRRAITPQTKAIMLMHYGGIPCARYDDLQLLHTLAKANGIVVIEDAATCFGSSIGEHPLGSVSDCSVISFDITKHITAVNGGLCLVGSPSLANKLTQAYHNGTNRSEFEKGEVDYYDWNSLGSKYAMNALSASILSSQLDMAHEVLHQLKQLSLHYINHLEGFAQEVSRHIFPSAQLMSNGHLFAWLAKDAGEQKQLIDFLDAKGIESHSHYRSLHSSPMSTGSGIGREAGDFEFTQNLPFRIVRLPIHSGLSIDDVDRVAEAIKLFYSNRTHKKS